jgi:hypothetical protein
LFFRKEFREDNYTPSRGTEKSTSQGGIAKIYHWGILKKIPASRGE